MYLRVLFDKNTQDPNFHIGWGISFLIDSGIIFDTAERGDWLLHNMKMAQIEFNSLKKVIISHDHWDHTGGLEDLLQLVPNLQVYACPGFSDEFKNKVKKYKANLIETENVKEIGKDIFVTGQMTTLYKGNSLVEQALVIKAEGNLNIITGCAHPGIINIVDYVRSKFEGKINMVIGGFHLMDKARREIEFIVSEFKKREVKKIAAGHCTGYEAMNIFSQVYKDNFIPIQTGQIIDLANNK